MKRFSVRRSADKQTYDVVEEVLVCTTNAEGTAAAIAEAMQRAAACALEKLNDH